MLCSDGKTPEDKIKQILQIHAILPGQKPERQFNIPSRTNSLQITQSNQFTQQPAQQPAEPPKQPQQSMEDAKRSGPISTTLLAHQQKQQDVGNLIDLRSPTGETPLHPVESKVPVVNATMINQAALKELKSPTESISSELRDQVAQEMPPSRLLHSNPEKAPQGRNVLRRLDSRTQEPEEFHDAES